jgi:hypothetical protein
MILLHETYKRRLEKCCILYNNVITYVILVSRGGSIFYYALLPLARLQRLYPITSRCLSSAQWKTQISHYVKISECFDQLVRNNQRN